MKNFIVEDAYKDKKRLGLGIGRIQGAPLYEGDIDIGRTVRILREAGHNYDLTLEDESLHRFNNTLWKEIIKKDVKCLKDALSMI